MNSSVLKKIGILFIFLAGIGIGASGLWLAIQNNNELRYFLLEQPTGNLPQAKIAAFVQSVVQGDQTAALKLWEVSDRSSPEQQNAMGIRRESVIFDLVSAKINPEYMILGIEWWTTCCEPNVTHDSRNAGGARIKVQFLDKNGLPILYTFDVFTREQPYWGDALGYPPRDWVIRDVYSDDKKPLFWRLIYESQIQSIQPSEP
jgi:hypothetical protein